MRLFGHGVGGFLLLALNLPFYAMVAVLHHVFNPSVTNWSLFQDEHSS